MSEDLDDGLKWRGRILDGDDSDEDVFGLYVERPTRPYDSDLIDDDDDDDDGVDDDDDDPLGGLVTIGDLRDDTVDVIEDAHTGAPESDDFIKQLELLIERDMPKVKITDEYQKVLDAVDASDGGLVADGGGAGRAGDGVARKDSEVLLGAAGTSTAGGPSDGNAEAVSRVDDVDGNDRSLPDLGEILEGTMEDPEAETLKELVEGLAVVGEETERERQARGTSFFE